MLSGVSAARKEGDDLISPGEIEAYVRSEDVESLVDEHKLSESSRPNVLLHVVHGRWPFAPNDRFASKAVVAVDLLESGDGRARRAGARLLDQLMKDHQR